MSYEYFDDIPYKLKKKKKYKTIIFSDMENYYNRYSGRALKLYAKFLNNHPKAKIIFQAERQQYIENVGTGTKYYDIEVIYYEKN